MNRVVGRGVNRSGGENGLCGSRRTPPGRSKPPKRENAMKTGIALTFWRPTLGVALAAFCVCGCESSSANSTSAPGAPATSAAQPTTATGANPGSTSTPVTLAASTSSTATNQVEAAEGTARVPLQPPPLSAGVAEIVELAQKGVGDEVLIEYVRKSSVAFDLTTDEILYLKDIGVSEEILAEMLRHGRAIAVQAEKPQSAPTPAAPVESAPAPAPEQAAPVPEQANASEAQPAPPSPPSAPPQPAPVYTQPVTQVNNYYYPSLAPYGTWIDLPSYGWVWQPACVRVVPGWQPYCDGGYWLYTDCGWYWHSTYSWGWAPFHYGRWHRHYTYGWVWVPGYEWSPAWVTWRYTDAYCGWAPLPPGCGWSAGIGLTWYGGRVGVGFSFGLGWDCYTFVGYHHFSGHPVHRHRIPGHQAQVVYNNSTVINNYIVGNNNTIINNGIPPSRVSSVTRSEIRKVHLHDVTSAPDGLHRAGRFESGNTRLAVYRPKAAPDAPPPRPQPLRRTSVSRTTPAASLPVSTGFSENRSPSAGLTKPVSENRGPASRPAKPSATRTANTESRLVRRQTPVAESVTRPGTTAPSTSVPGRVAPGRATDGTLAPAVRPTTHQAPTRKPATADAGRLQNVQRPSSSPTTPLTTTRPSKTESTAPSSVPRQNRTVTQPLQAPAQPSGPARSSSTAPASRIQSTPVERPSRSIPPPTSANEGSTRLRSQAVPATAPAQTTPNRAFASPQSVAPARAASSVPRQMPSQVYSQPVSVPSVTSRPRSFSQPAPPSPPSVPQRSFSPPVTAPSYSAPRSAGPPGVSAPLSRAPSMPSVSAAPRPSSRINSGGSSSSSGSAGRRPR